MPFITPRLIFDRRNYRAMGNQIRLVVANWEKNRIDRAIVASFNNRLIHRRGLICRYHRRNPQRPI